jgi:hypothetical protein
MSLFNLKELDMYKDASVNDVHEYKGFLIVEVFRYKTLDGEYLYSDFSVFPENDERGYREIKQTLEQVKESIDENLNDHSGAYQNDAGPTMGMSF